MSNILPHPASFKDPAGYVFESNGIYFRQVNKSYSAEYKLLMESGLYQQLIDQGKLLPHTEIPENKTGDDQWHQTLYPEQLDFITYPYEWSFSQLKDAALLTLSITRKSIEHGMILKDATPYNIQFHKGKAIFIDTLSFDRYDETKPWIAYRQFCETFLFPLYLEHYRKMDCIRWLSNYLHGIPVDVIAKLLPWRAKWNLGVRLHVFLQYNVSKRKEMTSNKQMAFSKQKLVNLLAHLESIISSLSSGYPPVSTWSNYYDETIIGKEYLQHKEKLVESFCNAFSYQRVIDLGANDGHFSRLLSKQGKQVIAVDSDSFCVEQIYVNAKQQQDQNIIACVNDLSNPSAGIGFDNTERSSFQQRAKADLVLALALIHHLVIGKNIPLQKLAASFEKMAPRLIIEFVPKQDEKVQQLLSTREDIFADYTIDEFERHFSVFYKIERKETITGTHRVLYSLIRK